MHAKGNSAGHHYNGKNNHDKNHAHAKDRHHNRDHKG